jgi:putative ABC transport system ATP-binding protein
VKDVVEAPTPLLEARSVAVSRAGVRVLDGLDFQLQAGEVVAIRGDSGAGKSTLLGVLTGLIAVQAGQIRLGGERLDTRSDRGRSAARLSAFGLVFQGDELVPELTLAENVTLPLRLQRQLRRSASDYDTIARRELIRLGVGELADRLPSEVSGGQLQRAAIARALIHRPAVVLADEPTASLDEDAARSAMRLLIEVSRDRDASVVVVTHDEAVAVSCDRWLLLRDGRLSSIGESAHSW